MERQVVRAFAPATAANLGFGAQVLGLAFNGLGDSVTVEGRPGRGVEVTEVTCRGLASSKKGQQCRTTVGTTEENYPRFAEIARCAAEVTLAQAGMERGLELTLTKAVPSMVGLGSAAATAAASAFAVNRLIGAPLRKQHLVHACLADPRLSELVQPDCLAPALLGGLILVREGEPQEFIRLPLPAQLMVVVVLPHLELPTAAPAQAAPLAPERARRAAANLAAFTTACFSHDLGLLARSIDGAGLDLSPSVEPAVAQLRHAIDAGLDAGALGSSLVGGGPALFALCRSGRSAREVGAALCRALAEQSIEAESVVADADCPGARGLAD
jgi:homoserine kinase